MFTLNWRHDGPLWKLDAGLGRAHGTDAIRSTDKGLFQAVVTRRTGVTVGFDQISDTRPGVITVIDNATRLPVDPYRLDNYSLISVAETPLRSADINLSAFANVRRDFLWRVPFTARAGLDFRQTSRDYRTGAFTWNYRGANVRGSAAPFLDTTIARRTGPYGFPEMQFADYKGAYDYFKANPDDFTLDANANYRARTMNSKWAREMTSAAYVRGDLALLERRLNLVGGVRFEQTNIDAQGPLTDLSRNVRRDAAGRPLRDAQGRPVPVTTNALETSQLTLLERAAVVDKEYLRAFPSLNASYNVRENLIARAAVSNSIGRPDFNQYAGGLSLPNTDNPPAANNRITVNNAGIKPWTATSYRLRLEYYFTGVGQFAVGAYRRDYENFFGNIITPATPEFLQLYALDPTEFGDYDVSTQYNVPETVRTTGWDASYKQALTFLPPWARGLQVFGNISSRRTKTADLGARGFNDIPHSGSWGISLTRPRFNVRLNVSFRASQRQGRVTGVGIEPDTFNYVPSRNTVDVLGEYHIWKRFTLFANLRNVGDVPNETVTEGPNTPDYALLRMRQRYGSLWTFGLKGTF
jgi:TonB-dependent receptor